VVRAKTAAIVTLWISRLTASSLLEKLETLVGLERLQQAQQTYIYSTEVIHGVSFVIGLLDLIGFKPLKKYTKSYKPKLAL
jgi:hypothetical protein